MTSSRRDLMLAYRWPAAIVVSSLIIAAALAVLAWVALRVLSRPIPIAIEGGLQVDKIVLPPTVTINATSALPVTVTDSVPLVTESPLEIQGPLKVNGVCARKPNSAESTRRFLLRLSPWMDPFR